MRYLRSTSHFSGLKVHRMRGDGTRSVCGRSKIGDLIDLIRPADVLCWNCFREHAPEREEQRLALASLRGVIH